MPSVPRTLANVEGIRGLTPPASLVFCVVDSPTLGPSSGEGRFLTPPHTGTGNKDVLGPTVLPPANGFATLHGFDITSALAAVCDDLAAKVPDLRHVQMDRVALSFCQTRRGSTHGMLAKLTPLRFEGGELTTVRDGQSWTIQRLFSGTREQWYILSVYLPRFFDLPFEEKLNTLVHELYHISPRCDGDIRRFGGRCFAHSASHRAFDEIVAMLCQGYLRRRSPRSPLLKFLHHDLAALRTAHGAVIGAQVPIPKLIPWHDTRAA